MDFIAISIEYKDKTFISDYVEVTDEKVNEIEELVKDGASGRLHYLSLKSANKQYSFPSKILEESIFSIVRKSV